MNLGQPLPRRNRRPLVADRRNFFKVELWTRNGRHAERAQLRNQIAIRDVSVTDRLPVLVILQRCVVSRLRTTNQSAFGNGATLGTSSAPVRGFRADPLSNRKITDDPRAAITQVVAPIS